MAALALAGIAAAQAETYPARQVTIIVPFAAGGPSDVIARIIGEQMSKRLGQPFINEVVSGAAGTIGTTRAARAAPDGYTLVMGHMGTHAASLALYANLAYDPRTDFVPIGLVLETPEVLVTRKDLPPNTLAEFMAYARQTKKLNMGHSGIGRSRMWAACCPIGDRINLTLVPFTGEIKSPTRCSAARSTASATRSSPDGARAGALAQGLGVATAQRHPPHRTCERPSRGCRSSAARSTAGAPKGTPAPVVGQRAPTSHADDDGLRKRLADPAPPSGKPAARCRWRRGQERTARLTPILQAAAKK
jgi:hypothetical protein